MKRISFLNNKGGVGKTASLTAVAHILAVEFGQRVLIVDMDPQSNSSALYGFTGSEETYSLLDVIHGKTYPITDTVEDILMDTKKDINDCIYETDYETLKIIPSYITLSAIENQLRANTDVPQQFKLDRQLRKVEDAFDYCLIDCGPSLSLLNVNALVASDAVYIPSKSDKDSRVGIANILRLVSTVAEYSPRLEQVRCFLTQYDDRKKICQEAYADCQEALGEQFIEITIPVSTKVEQTGAKAQPLYKLDPHGKATRAYIDLSKYMIADTKS
ncbi:MAG: ParA family protein [Lachnospiraceae bacterium]